MTRTNRETLRSDLIRPVELAMAAEVSVPSHSTSKVMPRRIDTILFDTLSANGISPQDADLDLCKDLVVRSTRFSRRAESRVLVEN
jgi:hypothetical protein